MDMKIKPGSEPGYYTITTADGRVIRSNETRYWAKVIYRTEAVRYVREQANAEFEKLADEADKINETPNAP